MKSTPLTPAEQAEFDKAVNFDLDEVPKKEDPEELQGELF